MKLENEITVEVLETKENVIKSISSNGFKLNNSILIRDISEKPNTRKLITYKQKHIDNNGNILNQINADELALQFVNDRIYIEIEEKCEHTGKRYESLDYMKSIIENLNLPIKDNNYYAKKAEDILNDKK